MNYRKLGRTGLKVSTICLGTMQWGWTTDKAQSFVVMDAFMDAGGNFIDTADMYSRWVEGNPGGVSESIIGEWMQNRKNRHQVVLATKVRGRMWEGPNGEGLSRKHIMHAVEESLRRLQTDYIDLYQIHWDDFETPIEETLQTLNDLVRQGKVRYIGASNLSAWRLMKSLSISDKHDWARYDSLQPHYNLAHRTEFERELKPLCESEEIGVIPYSPLAGGFLTGKYHLDTPPPDSARQESVKSKYFNEYGWRVLAAVERIADARGVQPLQIALAWLLNQPVITAPIIGANSIEQLMPSMEAVEIVLSDEEMALLDEASRTEGKL